MLLAYLLQAQLWFLSGVAAAVLSCYFGGSTRSVQIVLKEAQHPLFVGLDGKEVDDWVQAAVEVHQGNSNLQVGNR